MKFFLPIFCCFAALNLFGQQNFILQDASIDWAGYIEIVIPADPVSNTAEEDAFAEVSVLKLISDDEGLGKVNHSLSVKLWEMAREGQWELYEDAGLAKPLAFEGAMRRLMAPDTLIEFDPETYEETMTITSKEDFPSESPWIRVRQLLVYRNVSATFEVYTTAVAPCRYDGSPFYWMKLPAGSETYYGSVAQDTAIAWAVRYTTLDTSPDPESWDEVKNTTGPIITRFIDRIRPDSSITLHTPDNEPVTGPERRCLFSCVQKEKVFDPQRGMEQVQETVAGIDHEDISELQLVEEWAWDQLENQLYIRLIAVAPRFWVIPELGESTFPKVLFFRKCILTEP